MNRLSGFPTTETCFHSLVAGSQGSAWSSSGADPLLGQTASLLLYLCMVERERELVSSSPYEGTEPIMGAPPSWLLPRAPPLNAD